jgi:hypothetical protein
MKGYIMYSQNLQILVQNPICYLLVIQSTAIYLKCRLFGTLTRSHCNLNVKNNIPQ